jgi:hypothetical protein
MFGTFLHQMSIHDGPEKYIGPTFLGQKPDSESIPDLELDSRLWLEEMLKTGSFQDNYSQMYLFPQDPKFGVTLEVPGRVVLENIRRETPPVLGGKILQVIADLSFVSSSSSETMNLSAKRTPVTFGDTGGFFFMVAGEGMLPDGRTYRFLAVRNPKA